MRAPIYIRMRGKEKITDEADHPFSYLVLKVMQIHTSTNMVAPHLALEVRVLLS